MKYILILLATLVLKQCGIPTDQANNLVGNWHIASIYDTSTTALKTSFKLNAEKNQISTTVGCNMHNCNIKIADKNNVDISECIATEMYCEAIDKYEQMLRKALQETTYFEPTENNTIALKNNTKQTLLVLTKTTKE